MPTKAPDGASVDAEKGYTPTGAVNTLDEAEAMAEYFQANKVDGVILCPLDFGDERSAAKIAEKLGVPVMLYATKEPPAMDNPGMGRVSDSYCGNLGMATALHRRHIEFHWGGIIFPDEPEFKAEVETFVQAVSVVKGLKGARLGQVGVRPGTFETVAYDEAQLIKKFGQNVIYTEISDIVRVAEGYADDDPEVVRIMGEIRSGVAKVAVADDYVLKAAKLELALTAFFKQNKLSAMGVQCWPSIGSLMGISVCAIYGRLTGKHLFTACETDVVGGLAMLSTYYASMGTTVPHFIDWTIQHRDNPNWLMAWHCGNAPTSLAADPSKTALRSRMDMKGELPVEEGNPTAGLFQFQIKPGVVTFCRLAEYDGEWEMLIAKGKVVPSDEELAGTWSWVEVKDHAKLYRTLVENGFIHHAAMVHGDQSKALSWPASSSTSSR